MVYIQHLIKPMDRRIILIVLSLLAVLWVQGPRLADEFRVDRDFRSFYWFNRFQDSTLFQDDLLDRGRIDNVDIHLFGYDIPLHTASLGYSLLFYVSSFFVVPVIFSNILSFFLMSITVWYLFEFGQSARSRNIGTALASGFILLNLASSSSLSVLTGLQRSFTLPLIIVFIYYLQRQKYFATTVVGVISALIYAPVFVLAMATWGVFILKISWSPPLRVSITKRGFAFLLITCLLGLLVLSPVILPRFADTFTDNAPVKVSEQAAGATTTSYQNLWDNPLNQSGGPAPLFYTFPFVGRGGLVEDSEEVINFLILLVISGLIFLILGHRSFDLPRSIWSVLGAGFMTFALAWIAILLTDSYFLYVPNRYSRTGLFLFLLVFVVFNSRETAKEAVVIIRQNPQKLIWLIVGIELLIFGLILFYPSSMSKISGFNMKWLLTIGGLFLAVLGVRTIKGRSSANGSPSIFKIRQTLVGRLLIGLTIGVSLLGWGAYTQVTGAVGVIDPPPAERELLAFVETLPKDALLAGTPCALDNIPLFAKRKILFSCFYNLRHPSIPVALEAYYSDNPQTVIDFCQEYAIDYLVVDLETYSGEFLAKGEIFFEPYNRELLPYIAGRNTFVLAQIPDDMKLFQSENYYVVACDALGEID